ncbi:MAG: histidine phosphatase family protein [Candidatus Saccharimonadales bacterium]|nr:histidine phosphatase family protein [Candidatus Saccharimonadales bacterium]
MKIYAVRHGHTNYNRWHILNSDPKVDVRLTRRGRKQAEALAQEIQYIEFDHVYTSELPRTIETADIATRGREIERTVEPLINDIRTGMEKWPVWLWLLRLRLNKSPRSARFDGGETLDEARTRVFKGLDKIISSNHKSILIVGHMHTIHRLQERYEGRRGSAANARLCVFDTKSA